MVTSDAVIKSYFEGSFEARAFDVMAQEGLDRPGLTWADFARLDQFHTGGLEATKRFGELVHPEKSQSVLDVGSGLGGPARYLAATYGCSVTGIDLTPGFVHIATEISSRAGLADRTTFVEGDALHMPFADGTFDLAVTQHVAMNIHDREGLYREVHRVLKPGARFAIHDILIGNGEALDYPLPWAATAEISNVITLEAMDGAMQAAGFEQESVVDVTDGAKAFFATQVAASSSGGPASLAAFLGAEMGPRIANLGRQTMGGQLRMVMAVYRAI